MSEDRSTIESADSHGWLGSERRFLSLSTYLLGLLAFCKGIRLPNLWSATLAQIDYSSGFVKRGFFGQFISGPLHLNQYNRFAFVSFFALAGLLLLLFWFTAQTGIAARISQGAPVALFFSSIAFSYLAHLVGYLDILQAAATIALLLIRPPLLRLICAIPMALTCVLIHEAYLLLFLPVLLLSFLVDATEGRWKMKTAVFAATGLALVVVALTVMLALRTPLSMAQAFAMQHRIEARATFVPRWDTFEVMGRSAMDNLRLMLGQAHTVRYWLEQISAVLMYGPVLVFILFFAFRFCRESHNETVRNYGFWGVLLAICGPLSMHLIGFDVGRWDSLACLVGFAALGLLCRSQPMQNVMLSRRVFHGVVLVLALNMAAGEGLLDTTAPNPSPFIYSISSAIRNGHREGTFFPLPKE